MQIQTASSRFFDGIYKTSCLCPYRRVLIKTGKINLEISQNIKENTYNKVSLAA